MSGIIGESNIWQFVLKLLLGGFNKNVEYHMERKTCMLQYKWYNKWSTLDLTKFAKQPNQKSLPINHAYNILD